VKSNMCYFGTEKISAFWASEKPHIYNVPTTSHMESNFLTVYIPIFFSTFNHLTKNT